MIGYCVNPFATGNTLLCDWRFIYSLLYNLLETALIMELVPRKHSSLQFSFHTASESLEIFHRCLLHNDVFVNRLMSSGPPPDLSPISSSLCFRFRNSLFHCVSDLMSLASNIWKKSQTLMNRSILNPFRTGSCYDNNMAPFVHDSWATTSPLYYMRSDLAVSVFRNG